MTKTKDLRKRLIEYSVLIIEIVNCLDNSKASYHLGGQLLRSGTSPALNYGEAQGAESAKDFIHKMKVILKELRETDINLNIINKAALSQDTAKVECAISESNGLISIFVTSINTAKKNAKL
ncbi:MAG: four helix bundle protein [Bacteroidales bacterium]|nr:four helix bundle protein [Bacteroidales bacterium]MDD4217138.1 four helix bundle protein [Bacteroidales bacterium]